MRFITLLSPNDNFNPVELYVFAGDLYQNYQKADYLLNETVQKREAGEALRLGKNILTTLNYLP